MFNFHRSRFLEIFAIHIPNFLRDVPLFIEEKSLPRLTSCVSYYFPSLGPDDFGVLDIFMRRMYFNFP